MREKKKQVILTSYLPVMVPIIKIVGNWCNLDCEYCRYFSQHQQTRTVMSEVLLEKFIKEYYELFEGAVRFIWHGGEPLLAGISFFESVIRLQEQYQRETHETLNTVQTNGTLINEDWAKFFKTHGFRVGVSLDGFADVHNRFRKDRGGHGTFERVVKGIKTLREYNVPVGVLQTLTRNNISDPILVRRNFDFFVNSLNLKNIGTIVYNPIDNPHMKGQEVGNEELTRFYKMLIDLWLHQDDPDLRIREIDCFLAGITGKLASLCHFSGACSGYFCLEHDGKVYPCDTFSGKDEYLFGDLAKQHLWEILNSQRRLEWAERANSLHADCLGCKWQKACHNGCPGYRENGKYQFCETRRQVFSYLEEKMKILS